MKSRKFQGASLFTCMTALLVLLSLQLCNAQFYEVPFSEKVLNSSLIVEGRVTESIPFEANGEVFTCHKLNVLKSIYPQTSPCVLPQAEISEESYCIYVITLGGRLEGKIETWAHSLRLHEGDFGFFTLMPTSRPNLFSDVPSYEVYAGHQGFVRYDVDNKENFAGSEIFNEYTNPETELIQEVYNVLNLQLTSKSFIRDEWMLSYVIDNVSLLNNELSFDVSLKAVWGNRFKIKNLNVNLKYDTNYFGTNPLTQGNLAISLDPGLSQSGVSLASSQLQTNEVGINLTKNNITTGQFIGESYQKLFTVELTLQSTNFQELPYLDLITGASPQIITNELGTQVSTNETRLKVKPGDFLTCLVNGQIDNIAPLEVGAGVLQANSLVFDADIYGGIITITGCGFDDLDENNLAAEIPQNYRVEFEAANNGNQVSPFASDYLLWNDDEIQVRVPSIGYRVNFFGITLDPMFGLTAGNGAIKIRKPGLFNDLTSEQELTVRFAHWNWNFGDNPANHRAERLRLKAYDHLANPNINDGYEFFFTQAFIDNMPAGSQDAVGDALETWRCRVRVNFEIVDEANVEDPDFGTGRIDWGDVEAGLVADSKNVLFGSLQACENENDFPVSRLGIVFSNTRNFSANGVPGNGQYDVQTIALHEFGHNTLLAHVDPAEATMFQTTPSGAAGVDHVLGDGDESGGEHVVNVSTQQINCPPMLPPMVPLGPCAVNASKELTESSDEGQIIPNPNSGSFIIETTSNMLSFVSITTSNGTVVYSKSEIESHAHYPDITLSKGIYFVKGVLKDGSYFVKKIIVTQ